MGSFQSAVRSCHSTAQGPAGAPASLRAKPNPDACLSLANTHHRLCPTSLRSGRRAVMLSLDLAGHALPSRSWPLLIPLPECPSPESRMTRSSPPSGLSANVPFQGQPSENSLSSLVKIVAPTPEPLARSQPLRASFFSIALTSPDRLGSTHVQTLTQRHHHTHRKRVSSLYMETLGRREVGAASWLSWWLVFQPRRCPDRPMSRCILP